MSAEALAKAGASPSLFNRAAIDSIASFAASLFRGFYHPVALNNGAILSVVR